METIRVQLEQRFVVEQIGVTIFVALNDDGQPTVAISTEDMPAQYVYDEATGLPGTAEPYTYEQDGAYADEAQVKGPTGAVVSQHYGERVAARLAAREYANMLNERWAETCGMPDIQVLLGDAVLYDSEDHNPALRERRAKEVEVPC